MPQQKTLASVVAFVWSYWSVRLPQFFAVVAGVIAAASLEIQIPERASELIAGLRGQGVSGAKGPAAWLVATLVGVSIAQQLYQRVWIRLAADVMRRMVNDGFARVQRFGTEWHNSHFAGATVRKITRGMWAYDSLADIVMVNLGPALVLLVGFAIAMSIKSPWMGLYFSASVLVFLAVSVTTSFRYVSPAHRRSNEADTKISGALADAVTCNAVVKSFGAEVQEDRLMQEATRSWELRSRRGWRRSLDAGALQSLMIAGLIAGLLGIVLSQATSTAASVEGSVYVLSSYFVVNGYLRNVGWQVRELQRAVNEIEDLVDIAAMDPQIADAPGASDFRPQGGEVRFESVGFRYPNQLEPVFRDLDVSIKPGERVALVGPSGSGKTTFVKLIQRLYDVTSGRLLVDGQDVRGVGQASLRQSVALVPQDPILFHRTLRENIAYGAPNVGSEAVERAARQARAHDFISRLPIGYETLVGERGVKLSGGERQRVAIARAILADAPLLILDEATSSLDSVTEHQIQAAIEEAMQGRTAILIAHRLSTVRKADRILVFEYGKIVEEGTHGTLMARPRGAYRRLYDMQALGFVDMRVDTNAGFADSPRIRSDS